MGNIDESSIEALSFVINLTKFIELNSDSGTIGDNLFPKFLWILRDFSLQLKQDNDIITPSQYLENCLSTNNNSEIKQTIKK